MYPYELSQESDYGQKKKIIFDLGTKNFYSRVSRVLRKQNSVMLAFHIKTQFILKKDLKQESLPQHNMWD